MKVQSVFLSVLFLSAVPAYAAESSEKSTTSSAAESSEMLPVSPRMIRKALYGTVAAGALLSFIFWLPSTRVAVRRGGVLAAIGTTHIPRLALDVATIAACVTAWIYDSESKE